MWRGGFTINIGACPAVEAELWAVIQGLKLAWDKGFRKVRLEVDSLVVVKDWLMSTNSCNNNTSNLVFVCQQLLAQEWEVVINHVYRECNQAADFLANEALNHERGIEILQDPPAGILHLLSSDIMGIGHPRRIKTNNA